MFHLDILYEVVLPDGSTVVAFRSKGRSDFDDGTWIRFNPHRYGHMEAVEVQEVVGIAGREKQEAA